MKYIFISISFLISFNAISVQYTVRECDYIQSQIDNIRSEMRSGYSVQRGEYLKEKERKLLNERRTYCRNPKKPEKPKLYSTKNKKTKQYAYSNTKPIKRKPTNKKKQSLKTQRENWKKSYYKPYKPTVMTSDLTSKQLKAKLKQKSDFQRKQDAWIKYYKPLKACKETNKNLSNFVACTEDKKLQKSEFDSTYK